MPVAKPRTFVAKLRKRRIDFARNLQATEKIPKLKLFRINYGKEFISFDL